MPFDRAGTCQKESTKMSRKVGCVLSMSGILFALVSGTAHSQTTAEEVVARNLSAKGGIERLKALTSARITGKIVAQGREVPMTVWSKRPNLMRRQFLVDNQKVISGFDGTTLWAINPGMGGQPQEVTGPQAEVAREEAEFDNVFLDYKAKGHSVELVGAETLNGRTVHHLKLTRKNGMVQHYYIDVESNLEVRLVTHINQGGLKAEIATDFSDHRQVDGLTVPFTMRQSMNGTPGQQVVLETIEFNVPIDDTLFRMPRR
jgi:outer membrane lipoprotein-sorting protein